jgi:hypothetical protein
MAENIPTVIFKKIQESTPGVKVINAIFGDVCQFSSKNGVLLKNYAGTLFAAQTISIFCKQTPFFSAKLF